MEFSRRNALYRAWAAYGLPVQAAWRLRLWHVGLPGGWRFTVECAACLRTDWRAWPYRELEESEAFLKIEIERMERSTILEVTGRRGELCLHLYPLLGRWPPEDVMAIYELELLAGG